MSMAGWWMVHAIVRPVSTMLRTTRITIAAARASRPAQQQLTHSNPEYYTLNHTRKVYGYVNQLSQQVRLQNLDAGSQSCA